MKTLYIQKLIRRNQINTYGEMYSFKCMEQREKEKIKID